MKTGPDFTIVASLIGDPARANMLTALMSGRALTASELAQEAGITPQTASSHLAKLESGHLVTLEKQGRHRYYRLKGPEVAAALEGLMGLAARAGHLRVRTGPKDPALRRARVCYDHLAGDLGVQMLESMIGRGLIQAHNDALSLTPQGKGVMERFCKTCLDWSARRSHLAGTLGAAILSRLFALKWARREPNSRIVSFTPKGEREFASLFGGGPIAAANCAVDSNIQKNA